MDRRILKWFLFLCFVIFFAALIFIFAMPKDIEAKRDISSFPEAEIEDFDSVKDLQEVRINYKNEDKIINIGKKIELPLLSLLCSVESVGLKKISQGEELLVMVKTETCGVLVAIAIILSFVGLIVICGFLKPWV